MTSNPLAEPLRRLLLWAESEQCQHESTHRGGVLWTICDDCGRKWADDEEGFPGYQEPQAITQARQALDDYDGKVTVTLHPVDPDSDAWSRTAPETILVARSRPRLSVSLSSVLPCDSCETEFPFEFSGEFPSGTRTLVARGITCPNCAATYTVEFDTRAKIG